MTTEPDPQASRSAYQRAVTIQDVAQLAGVSRAAVSKVIRGAYGVSDSMKERVGAAIKELNYRPSLVARAMRGSTYTIGFEIPGLRNDFLFRIVDGADDALKGTGYQLIVAPATNEASEGYRAIGSLADRQVDGIVAIGPLVLTDWLEELSARIPLVMIGRHTNPTHYDSIVGDDESGANQVMDHLLAQGHRRIAHLTGPEDITDVSNGGPHSVRHRRYLERMIEAGLEDEILVWRTGPFRRDAVGPARELLARSDRPTAVFAGNDELALGVLDAMDELGLTARDVALVGYDDIDAARIPGVGLSSVDQAGFEMGQDAVRLLMERIAGRTEPTRIVKPATLRVRASSSTPLAR